MIEGLKPYAEYKETGIPWTRALPSHWVTKRGKSYLVAIDERSKAGKEELLTVSSTRGVVPRSSAKVTMFKAESYAGHKLCWPGDLVINSLWAWGGGLGVTPHHGIISTAYSVYRSRPSAQINPRFLHELVRSSAFHWELQVRSKGVWISRLQLTDTSFLDAPIPLPPPEEQAAIVRFLDHANRKIDGFIRAKRKLIGLLNEQKQAIIHRAVTRGLGREEEDPQISQISADKNSKNLRKSAKSADKKFKPSGIPWLAEAPANWTWIPIKLLLSRMDYGTSEKSTASGSIRILTMGNIQKGEVTVPRSGGLNCLPDSLLLQHHDLLFTRTNGNPNLVGKVGIFRGEVSDRISFASYLVRLRVKRLYDPEWLHMVLNSAAFWPFARSHALVNLQTNLNSTRYGQFPVPVPPLVEQKEIVKWVGGESVNLNTAIARTEREIALMQEYRTRLTADIVTGKLDVREAAAKLLDLPGDSVAEEVVDNLDETGNLVETETEEI